MPEARLTLVTLEPGVAMPAPEGLQVGDSVPVPAAVVGRWITIGSGPDQDLVLRDDPRGIRRSHARMTFRDGAYRIQGRITPEGYHLNGERFNDCTARPLHDGDLLQLGPHATFRFSTGE